MISIIEPPPPKVFAPPPVALLPSTSVPAPAFVKMTAAAPVGAPTPLVIWPARIKPGRKFEGVALATLKVGAPLSVVAPVNWRS